MKHLHFLPLLFAGSLLAGCGTQTTPDTTLQGISIRKSLTLEVGETKQLYVIFEPEELEEQYANTVTWESSRTRIATVDDNGKITAVHEGTAEITATCMGFEAVCKVEVITEGTTPETPETPDNPSIVPPTGPYFSYAKDKYLRFAPGNCIMSITEGNAMEFAKEQYLLGQSLRYAVAMMYINQSSLYDITGLIAGAPEGTWFTPSKEQLNYILNERPDAVSLKSIAKVDDVQGLLLLPDNFTYPSGEKTLTEYGTQMPIFTTETWKAMENNGAIFLPATDENAIDGRYWTSTRDGSNNAYLLHFNTNECAFESTYYKFPEKLRLVDYL